MHRIISILPKGEGFSPKQFGAIALCVRDFTLHSRYKEETLVLGGSHPGFEDIQYQALSPARWFENRTRSYARHAARIINNGQTELVEIHNRPHLLHLIAARIAGPKIVLHLHNDPQEMDKARTVVERHILLDRCAGIYCVSHYIKNRFLEGLEQHTHAKNVHVIYNGIAIPPCVQKKEKHIVFAGRMTEGKGARELAQALSIALPLLPDWRAIFIGSERHQESKTLSHYEKEVGDILKPIHAQIEWTGFLPHPETLARFASAAIAIIPSVWQEPFGRTALEAMAYGSAVISSGRGGLKEVTADAAITAEPAAQPLADALLKLAQNPEECEKFGQKSRQRAERFAIEKVTETLDDARDFILTRRDPYAA